MINIIGKTKYSYAFSITLTILAVASLFVWGMNFGIDFTGGTLMEIKFGPPNGEASETLPANSEVEEVLKPLELKSLTLQATGNQSLRIRYASVEDSVNSEVLQSIKDKYPEAQELKIEYTNSSVSSELKKNSLWAIFWAIAGIMSYVAWAFRKVSRPVESWRYGLGAVVALAHDVLITIGVFSVLGHFWGVEVGVPFVAALLTILGFSVHDTIVVYDRTRENLLKASAKELFPDVVNRSLNETLVRSINTSMTVIVTLLAIYLFGGESIKDFALALLVGVTFGTYSSIFVASALLVTSYKLQLKGKK